MCSALIQFLNVELFGSLMILMVDNLRSTMAIHPHGIEFSYHRRKNKLGLHMICEWCVCVCAFGISTINAKYLFS